MNESNNKIIKFYSWVADTIKGLKETGILRRVGNPLLLATAVVLSVLIVKVSYNFADEYLLNKYSDQLSTTDRENLYERYYGERQQTRRSEYTYEEATAEISAQHQLILYDFFNLFTETYDQSEPENSEPSKKNELPKNYETVRINDPAEKSSAIINLTIRFSAFPLVINWTSFVFAVLALNTGNKKTLIASVICAVLLSGYECVMVNETNKIIEENKSLVQLVSYNIPLIYMYSDEDISVNVKLDIDGTLTCTYPEYPDTGWNVNVTSDGTLTDSNGREYEYILWEADANMECDLSQGYCVKGSDTASFFENALKELGLSDKEANAFIVFWLPQMENNPYNVICFQTDNYEEAAQLDISPAPDNIIRVNMLYYASDDYVEIEAQDLSSINNTDRSGFTVVEWGGEEIDR